MNKYPIFLTSGSSFLKKKKKFIFLFGCTILSYGPQDLQFLSQHAESLDAVSADTFEKSGGLQ